MRAIKPYLFFLLLAGLFAPKLYSQAALGIYAMDIEAIPSTVSYGDTVKYSFEVENRGNAFYLGQVEVWIMYQTGTAIQQEIFDINITDTLWPGGTHPILVDNELVTSAKYGIGDNAVVIWPRSNQPNVPTVDSAIAWVHVQQDTGVNGIEGPVKDRIAIFPNPTSGNLFLNHFGYGNKFESVRLIDLQGRILEAYTQPVTQLQTADLPKGLYFVELRYSDGLRGTFRVIVE